MTRVVFSDRENSAPEPPATFKRRRVFPFPSCHSSLICEKVLKGPLITGGFLCAIPALTAFAVNRISLYFCLVSSTVSI